MPGAVVFTVRHLALDTDSAEQEILGKHIFQIGIYLSYAINIFHHTSFASTPFTKDGAPSLL